MSDNQYIKRQQRERNKSFLTPRNIFFLIFLSAAVGAFFYFEYGIIDDGTCEGVCESLYSIRAWALSFLIIFGAVIGAAIFIGALAAFLRWNSARKGDALASLLDDSNQTDT